MKIVIVGAGSVGSSIARELSRAQHEIAIIDRNAKAMKVSSVPDAEWNMGDACEVPILDKAGAGEADILVAATGDDKINLVASLLAKSEFGVPRVIARINNPRNEWLFNESWGVDIAVSTPRIMTSLVEDAVADGTLVSVMNFQRSGASLMQTTLPEEAPIVGIPVSEVLLPPTIILTAIVRDGTPLPADPDLTIEAEDQIILLCAREAEEDLDLVRSLFSALDEDEDE